MAISVRPEVEVVVKTDDVRPPDYGSGVFIGGRLVLTASYIVGAGESARSVRIRMMDGKAYDCEVVWASTETVRAVALLKVVDSTWNSDLDFAPASFGRIQGDGLVNCEIVGFPDYALYDDEESGNSYSDADQISGIISPLAGSRSGYMSISVISARVPARTGQLGRSQWTGMAGAPVRCQGHLVGIVSSSNGETTLRAVRIERIAEDSHFTELVEKEIKGKITFTDVSRAESFADKVTSVIDGVATVDSSNTQQVAALELALSKAYYERVLAQARSSFISALVSAGIGLLFFLGAISVSLVTGKLNAALISTISGAIIEVISGLNFWLYSQTSAQLDAFHLRIERMQRFLLANSVATSVKDPQQKDNVVSHLVDTIANSTVEVRNARAQAQSPEGSQTSRRRTASRGRGASSNG